MLQTLRSNVSVGIEALRIHPMRTLLAVTGILIGSAALVATMALSDGLMTYVRDRVQRETSVQVITLSPRTSVREHGEWVAVRDAPVFDEADVRALERSIPAVRSATLLLGGAARVRYGGIERAASVVLGTEAMLEFGTFELGAGRFFVAPEVERNAPVVVINYALARELSPGRDPHSMAGKLVRVHSRTRRVIGVLAATGFEDPDDPNGVVYAPIRSARALLVPPPDGRFRPAIRLLAGSVESIDAVESEAADWLARRVPNGAERVLVTVGREQIHEIEQAFLVMKVFVGALVGISLLVGGIGIMNVLLASVAERTREIGIRKSVGARRADIRAQFLAESVAIALAGAATGLVVGFLLAALLTLLFRVWTHAEVYPVLSWTSVLIATLSSSFVGLVFGTYPARRAASLPPSVAMAHE